MERIILPTRVRIPLWERKLTGIRSALSSFDISDIRTRRVGDFRPRGLMLPLAFSPGAEITIEKPSLDPAAYMDKIESTMSTTYDDVVRWMQTCAADYAVLHARELEYNRLGSSMVTDAGDAAVGNVVVQDISMRADRGPRVRRRGYAIAQTPRGNYNVEALGKGHGIFRDSISAGTVPRTGSYQYRGNLVKWTSLAETPITDPVGFIGDYRGSILSNFFAQTPARPKLSARVRQRFQSDKDQTIGLNFREPSDYRRVLSSRNVALAEGSNEVEYTVSGFPYVATSVAQIQPEDNTQTSLEEYVVV